MPKKILALCIIIPVLIVSCKKDTPNIVVYTDIPEAVILMNQFNTDQSDFTVETLFLNNPEENISLESTDLILARDIHAPAYMELMKNLNKYRANEFLQGIYPEILQSCILDTELKLIPLSLGLPLAVRSTPTESAGKYIDWKTLSEEASAVNSYNDGHLTRTGFSPLWSDDFILSYLTAGSGSTLTLLETEGDYYLKKTGELTQWIEENNSGSTEIERFMEKYMYIPDYRLLSSDRIGFCIMKLSDYLLLTDSITHKLSFKLFTVSGRLQPTQIISAGIPEGAPNSDGAEALLSWLIQKDTWESFIYSTIRNRDKAFGLEGISASYTINESIFSKAYPILKEHIPYPGEFDRISTPVPQWKRIKQELLLPHTLKVLKGEEQSSDLGEEYRKWLLLNPDPLLIH